MCYKMAELSFVEYNVILEQELAASTGTKHGNSGGQLIEFVPGGGQLIEFVPGGQLIEFVPGMRRQ